MTNNVGELLSRRAALSGSREAYVDSVSGLRLTFEQLNSRCNQIANALLGSGVKPGDRVGLLLKNSPEFLEAYFGIAKIGGVVVPINWRLIPDELEFILKDSGVTTFIFGDEFIDNVAELHSRKGKTDINQWLIVSESGNASEFSKDYTAFREGGSAVEPLIQAENDDLLFIMYTSGTTGLPKGVVHTHATTQAALQTFVVSIDTRIGDVFLAALPMFHVGALLPVTLNIYCGVTSVVVREFNPALTWQLIEDEKITSGLLVPAMLNFMLQAPNVNEHDFSSVRSFLSGAAPLPVSLIEKYYELGIEIHQIYGLTETCGPGCAINADSTLQKMGSAGQSYFHTKVRIMDDSGQECDPGEPGEIWVLGAHNMKAYWNRPDATAETLTPEGWLRTGDVASMDEDGYVTIKDRLKDMIITGGENVCPAEIENIILGHPDVADVAVIGQPSKRWGESPLAVVVGKAESLTEPDILKYCDDKLARFKQPKGAVFIDQIPRNPSGKVLKRVLREQFPDAAPE
jgi:acyl-CoA synthetase (AMP-forming)/AMP-acid ligase II